MMDVRLMTDKSHVVFDAEGSGERLECGAIGAVTDDDGRHFGDF